MKYLPMMFSATWLALIGASCGYLSAWRLIETLSLCGKVNTTNTVYPKGITLTDFPISIRLTSLALWQSDDCPSASKATLMNMDKYFIWIHYERLHNHNKANHNKTVCIFLGIYCRPYHSAASHWWDSAYIYIYIYMGSMISIGA